MACFRCETTTEQSGSILDLVKESRAEQFSKSRDVTPGERFFHPGSSTAEGQSVKL